jgi:hypothetical protein
MRKVTLVCSSHREKGLCNARELLGILRAIGPDTIFFEARPSDLDLHSKTLEGEALKIYRERNPFNGVPVDRYEIHAEFRATIDRVLDRVLDNSDEYLALHQEIEYSAHCRGFSYLNGVPFAQVRTRMSEIEDEVTYATGDETLIRGLQMWRRVERERNVEMVRNIYKYCRESVFDVGMFLVGAAHKGGIVEAVEVCSSTEPDLVEWKFDL